MMRLPCFRFHAPRTVREAAELLASTPGAMLVAGGTDLLPNMKRRQQVPGTLVGLRRVAELRTITRGATLSGSPANDDELTIGAGVTLTELVRDGRIRQGYGALWQAAAQIATPHLRNMGTLGGNLCLDTRCNYYDQNYEWRKAIDFCMKKDGGTCWVATSSPTCLAVSSTDTAPALLALAGRRITDELIATAATLAARPAKPMDNTDFTLLWRKRVTRDFVTYALRELRGDDVRELRHRVSRMLL